MNTHRLWDDNDKAHKGQKTRAQLVDKLFNDTSRENINYIICLLLSRFIMYVHKYLKVLIKYKYYKEIGYLSFERRNVNKMIQFI